MARQREREGKRRKKLLNFCPRHPLPPKVFFPSKTFTQAHEGSSFFQKLLGTCAYPLDRPGLPKMLQRPSLPALGRPGLRGFHQPSQQNEGELTVLSHSVGTWGPSAKPGLSSPTYSGPISGSGLIESSPTPSLWPWSEGGMDIKELEELNVFPLTSDVLLRIE